MTYEIGGNFIIDGGSVVFQNDVVVLAQNNIEFLNGAVLDMQGTTVQSVQLEAKEDIFFQGEMAGVTNTDPIAPVSLNVSAGRDFIMEPGTVAYTDGTGSCLLSAGRDLLIQESCDVHTSTGDLTLMADNHPIDSVEVWTGSFVKKETAKVASAGALKIFAADQGKILILGEINATPYVAGPEFVNSSREIWGAHFSSYEEGPFTIFYKNVYVPFSLIQAFNESVYEFLQNIQKFDRFYWDLKEISAGNREHPSNYTIIDPTYWLPDIYCK